MSGGCELGFVQISAEVIPANGNGANQICEVGEEDENPEESQPNCEAGKG